MPQGPGGDVVKSELAKPVGAAAGRPSTFLRQGAIATALGVVVIGLSWLAIRFLYAPHAGVSALWPVNGLAVAVLLRRPRREWAGLLCVTVAAYVITGVGIGKNPAEAVGLALCNGAEIWLCAGVLARFTNGGVDLSRQRDLLVFGAAAVGAAFVSAVGAMSVTAMTTSVAPWHTFRVWWPADALGLITVTPALLVLGARTPRPRPAAASWPRTGMVIAAQLVVTALVCLKDPIGLKWVIFAAFVAPALLLDAAGVALAVLAGAAILIGFSAIRASFAGGDADHQALVLQVFLSATAAITLGLAAFGAERGRLKASAQASARQFQMLAENANDLVTAVDLDGRLIYASPVCAALTGYEAAELVGRSPMRVIHPDDRVRVEDEFRRALQADSGQRIQYRLLHKDGRVCWVEARPKILRDPVTGAIAGVTDVIRDISERRQAEEALAKSETRYRLLADMSRDLIVQWDAGGVIQYVSPACKILGYTAKEMVGRPMLDMLHPDSRAVAEAYTRKMMEGEDRAQAGRREYRTLCKDGSSLWLEGYSSVVRDKAGDIIGGVSHLMDVTARRAAEEARAESELRYRRLAEFSTDIILQFDLKGEVLYASPSTRALGYDPSEIVGHPILDLIHPEDQGAVSVRAKAVLDGALGELGDTQVYRVRTASCGWVWLEGRPSLIRDDQGRAIGYISQLRDVSERVALTAELERKRAEAEAAAEAKTEFLANMSHEIRTPLTSIIGFAGLLESSSELSPSAARFVSRIVTAGHTLLAVVNDVLDFSKIEAGQIELDPQPFDPTRFIAETLDLASGQASAKGLTLASAIEGELPAFVLADSSRARQVLLNLLGNAIKFTSRGGVSVRVRYEAQGGGMLRVEVADTGVGIPPERLDRLFQRFSQVDGSISRTYGGTGLGLAISKSLAETMGGAIGVSSVVGEGSTFWFTIAAPPADLALARAAPQLAPDEQRGARILVVDDVANNRELIAAMLSPFGHILMEAETGMEAVDLARRQAFDLILMDLQMPGMDGQSATRLIRQTSDLNRATPIVAISANAMPTHLAQCAAAGMDDHIAKPIQPMELLVKVAQWTARDADEGEFEEPAQIAG
jgi:PAS domain S-box-containing protein